MLISEQQSNSLNQEVFRQNLPLPDEIIYEIFSFLGQNDLQNVSLVSFKFRNICFEYKTRKLNHLCKRLLLTQTIDTYYKKNTLSKRDYKYPFKCLEEMFATPFKNYDTLEKHIDFVKEIFKNSLKNIICSDIHEINEIANELSLGKTFVQDHQGLFSLHIVHKCNKCEFYKSYF